jgi:hypothetical protein
MPEEIARGKLTAGTKKYEIFVLSLLQICRNGDTIYS